MSARQLEPTSGTGGAATVAPKPLVQVHRVALKSGGKVTLMLRPTAKGRLCWAGARPVRPNVTFDSADGRSASKVVALTLRK